MKEIKKPASPDGFIYVIRINSSDFLCDSVPFYTSNLKYAKHYMTETNAIKRAERIRERGVDAEVVEIGFYISVGRKNGKL